MPEPVVNPVTPSSPVSYEDWCAEYQKLSLLSDQWQDAIRAQMKKLSVEAGLDPNLLGIHPHNAMCGYNAGKPLPNVDYDRVKMILKLQEVQFEVSRAVTKWDKIVRVWA